MSLMLPLASRIGAASPTTLQDLEILAANPVEKLRREAAGGDAAFKSWDSVAP